MNVIALHPFIVLCMFIWAVCGIVAVILKRHTPLDYAIGASILIGIACLIAHNNGYLR